MSVGKFPTLAHDLTSLITRLSAQTIRSYEFDSFTKHIDKLTMTFSFFVFLCLLATEIYGIECPTGSFASFSGTKCYFVPDDTTEFIPAISACQQKNGTLASVDSAFDNLGLISE